LASAEPILYLEEMPLTRRHAAGELRVSLASQSPDPPPGLAGRSGETGGLSDKGGCMTAGPDSPLKDKNYDLITVLQASLRNVCKI
jgi:hypothetical protein